MADVLFCANSQILDFGGTTGGGYLLRRLSDVYALILRFLTFWGRPIVHMRCSDVQIVDSWGRLIVDMCCADFQTFDFSGTTNRGFVLRRCSDV